MSEYWHKEADYLKTSKLSEVQGLAKAYLEQEKLVTKYRSALEKIEKGTDFKGDGLDDWSTLNRIARKALEEDHEA